MDASPITADRTGGGEATSRENEGRPLGETQAIVGTIGLSPHDSSPHTALARWLNPNPKSLLLAACWVFLVLWGVWWCCSVHRQELAAGPRMWFQPPAFGVDFYHHVDRPSRIWWDGGDPYADQEYFFAYPPSVMRIFSWVNYLTPRTALSIWLLVMTAIIAAAAWATSRSRRRLSLSKIPPIAAIVLILFSTPVLFAMERGQYDPLILLFILAALPLLRHPSKWAQFAAGAVLCLAPWAKVYPGLLVVGLVGMRRWRALAAFVVVGIALCLVNFAEMRQFLVNNAIHIRKTEDFALAFPGGPCAWNHPLALVWASLWLGTKLSWLALIPGKIAAAALLLPPLAWVTYHVYRSPGRAALAYPYFLWIMALATFVPPVSNDYNLCFLPLAVLAAWDRRDPLLVHVAIALLFLWWQPVGMSIHGKAVFGIKLLGLLALAVSLVERACEQARMAGAIEERDAVTAATPAMAA